ncbi:hypothetical protein, partial [Klebsiella aerogenes]|uniref:hypothetical protein n=1 Tax=Klebsiella aerogenes TaxID=548 RepID=UPI0013D3176E
VIRAIRELQQEGNPDAANNLADTAFGGQGRRVAKETEQGGFDLDRLAQSGLRSGKIISPEAIARSADIRERSERLVERGADAL